MNDVAGAVKRWKSVLEEVGTAGAEFLARHPEPAMILEPFGERSAQSIDTPSGADPAAFARTTTGAVASPQMFAGSSGNMVHPDARVVWLVKSDRNPFAGLVTLGRAKNNDIVLPHPSISKMHAIFHQGPNQWLIEDRKSTNGTFLDGVKLVSEKRYTLNEGASLRLGDAIMARYFEAETFVDFCRLVRGQE